jgi:outer membrane immunogenic protein
MYKMMLGLAAGLTLLSGAAMADGSRGKAASCCDAARPWTGFYLGIGAGAGATVADVSLGGFIGVDGVGAEGAFGTFVVGYDRMLTSRIVGGVFADYDFASNVSTDVSIDGFGFSLDQKNTFSVGTRLGVLSSPTTLWYGTVGYTQTEFDLKIAGLGTPDFKGYFVGAGVESQLAGGWNLRAEYRFSQFDNETFFDELSIEPSSHSARFALTYKFGREEPTHAHAPMK